MQVSVEKVSNVERRLTIVVPADQVEEAYTKQINEFAKKANIKGFRPGKAPISYIQERFGSDARQEALNEVIQKSLYQAIMDEKLNPVSAPSVEPKSILANQPLEFVASFEILPEIDKINFTLAHVEKPMVDITPEEVEKVLGQLSKQYIKWKLVDRTAQEKDRIVIDYYAIFEGKSDLENKVQNFPLELGSNTMLPGFETGLIGTKAEDELTLNLAFPADFQIQEKAGKPIDFVITVKQVFEAEIPALNDEFVKRLGVKSGELTELKEQIKQSLEQERDRLVREKLKEQIFKALLEQNPIDVPKSLVAQEAKNIHDEVYQHQHHDHNQHSDAEMTAFNDVAKKRVAIGILIAEYAKQGQIQLDKARVQKRVLEIAAAYENPKEVIEWLSTDNRISGIESQVMEDQVMEKLLEPISVIEKTMNYDELRNAR